MSKIRPILFNTDMVRAILDGRKTVTRRVLKLPNYCPHCMIMHMDFEYDKPAKDLYCTRCGEPLYKGEMPSHYQPGDILYVRETWFYEMRLHDKVAGEPDLPSGRYSHRYVYKADSPYYPVGIGVGANGWRPSIHMPKEAARIWLRVTAVRAEWLQEMKLKDFLSEGLMVRPEAFNDPENVYLQCRREFITIWNSTIKKSDLDRYGWEANPWVWVIEFERCEKPDGGNS